MAVRYNWVGLETKTSSFDIQVRRVYEFPQAADGKRILVDRLWPRGVSKEKAKIDYWAKDAAPSTGLRRWYGHDPEKWAQFKAEYFAELDANPDSVAELLSQLQSGPATFVFSSKEQALNNAFALKEYILSKAEAV